MSFQLNMVPDESSKRFLAAMQRGAEFNALAGPGGSSSGQPGVSGTPATNTASFYLAYGESSIISEPVCIVCFRSVKQKLNYLQN